MEHRLVAHPTVLRFVSMDVGTLTLTGPRPPYDSSHPLDRTLDVLCY